MKIEKIVCDRCGREISPLMNKPSITLYKEDSSVTFHRVENELDLCGMCITSFFKWYNMEENKNE